MSNNTQTAVVKQRESKEMEYIPFGSETKIKLSIGIVQSLVCSKTKSGKTCSEQEAIKFMMMCQARGLNPFEGDAYLLGYDAKDGPQFSLITAHQAFLKRAELHPEYDGMESGVIVIDENGNLVEREGDFYLKGEEILGAWAKVHFKGRKFPMVKKLRLATFRKPYGVWNDNPEGMIVKCAEADALRSSFPTKLGGMYLREELSLPNDPESRFAAAKPALVNPIQPETPNFLAAPAEPSPEAAPVEEVAHAERGQQ